MTRLGTLLATLMALTSFAIGEELGKITAFVDGEERIWHTITFQQTGKVIPTATFRQSGHLAELQIQGHPIPEFTSKDVFSIDTRFFGQYTPGDAPMAVDILFTPNGLSGPLWTSRGAPESPRVQIVSMDVWGKVGHVIAAFSGQICKRPRLFSSTDPNDCKKVTGKIDSQISVK